MLACDNAPMSFVVECVGEGLEEGFDNQVNNATSNGAESCVTGCFGRNSAGVNSV